jgi:hypothetical protein
MMRLIAFYKLPVSIQEPALRLTRRLLRKANAREIKRKAYYKMELRRASAQIANRRGAAQESLAEGRKRN